jgi:hypothetical protein
MKSKEVSVYCPSTCDGMTDASRITDETSIRCVVLFIVRYDLNF